MGIVGEAERADQVLDVRGFDETKPAVLDERDRTFRQCEFQERAVVIGAYQDRLVAQERASFAGFKNAITHFLDLGIFVVAVHELGPRARRTMRAEASPKT